MGKAFKFVASALFGIPLALVATTFLGAVYLAMKAANIFHIRTIQDFFGKNFLPDATWTKRLNDIEGFIKSFWGEFGIFSLKIVAKGIGEEAKILQAELGYGDSADKGNTRENRLAKGPEEDYKKDLIDKITDASPTLSPIPSSAELLSEKGKENAKGGLITRHQ